MVMSLCACGEQADGRGRKQQLHRAVYNRETRGSPKDQATASGGADAEYTELAMRLGTSSSETTLTAKTFAEWGERVREKAAAGFS